MVQGAPDLALTQLLVETLVLVVFVLVLRHLPPRFADERQRMGVPIAPRAVLAVLVGVFAALAVLVAFDARPDVPTVGDAFIAEAPEAGGKNVVNVALVEFRAFDTMGEITVLVVTSLGVLGLVRAARRERQRTRTRGAVRPYRPSPILDAAVRSLFHTVVLFSIVLLLTGHDRPGGGFVGGLVAGGAFMLVYLSGGARGLKRAEPITPEVFLGSGVALAALTGVVGWLGGGEFLEAAAWKADVPVLGTLKLSTGLVFDVGVYLVVLGVVIALLRALGREEVTR
jgi:multicomponent Na+:H+ antiporter subunit A